MSIRTRLAELIAGKPPVVVENATPSGGIIQGSNLWDAFTGNDGNSTSISERTALTVSAIYACVNLIAGAISALPINIYRQNIDNGERVRIYNDPLIWVFNEQMMPRWSAAAGWEYLLQSLLLQGDAFAKILRNNAGEPIGLEPIHPARVTVAVTQDLSRLIYAVTKEFVTENVSKGYDVLDQDDMLHIPGFGFDGFRGLPPLRNQLKVTGYTSSAMQDYSAAFFTNSARPDYALKTDQKLGQDAIDSMRNQIDENHRGTAKSHRPMLLHSGLDIKTISMPPEDMQLIQSRAIQIEEIASIFGVPPFMIGHNEKTTSFGTGIDSLGIGFVRYTLKQHLNKIQTEINRKCFRTAARIAEFDTTDLERADTKSFYEGLRIAVGRAGEPQLMTVNEARAEMRRNKQPGFDTLTVNQTAAGATPNATQQQAA